jgi:hypothetical protein
MGTLLVIVLSVVVGAVTYAATIRNGRRVPAAIGFEPSRGVALASAVAPAEPLDDGPDAEVVALDPAREAATETISVPPAPAMTGVAPVAAVPGELAGEPTYTYLRVATRGPSWRDRVAGLAGIVVFLVVGAAALAFCVYEAGRAITDLVQHFLNG